MGRRQLASSRTSQHDSKPDMCCKFALALSLDAAIRLDALKRGALIAELHDLMPTCLKQTGHDQPRGPARIN